MKCKCLMIFTAFITNCIERAWQNQMFWGCSLLLSGLKQLKKNTRNVSFKEKSKQKLTFTCARWLWKVRRKLKFAFSPAGWSVKCLNIILASTLCLFYSTVSFSRTRKAPKLYMTNPKWYKGHSSTQAVITIMVIISQAWDKTDSTTLNPGEFANFSQHGVNF